MLAFTVCTQSGRARRNITSSHARSPYRRAVREIQPRPLPSESPLGRPRPLPGSLGGRPPAPSASVHWADPSPGDPIGQPRPTHPSTRPLPTPHLLPLGSSGSTTLGEVAASRSGAGTGLRGRGTEPPTVLKSAVFKRATARFWAVLRSGLGYSGHAHSVGLGWDLKISAILVSIQEAMTSLISVVAQGGFSVCEG